MAGMARLASKETAKLANTAPGKFRRKFDKRPTDTSQADSSRLGQQLQGDVNPPQITSSFSHQSDTSGVGFWDPSGPPPHTEKSLTEPSHLNRPPKDTLTGKERADQDTSDVSGKKPEKDRLSHLNEEINSINRSLSSIRANLGKSKENANIDIHDESFCLYRENVYEEYKLARDKKTDNIGYLQKKREELMRNPDYISWRKKSIEQLGNMIYTGDPKEDLQKYGRDLDLYNDLLTEELEKLSKDGESLVPIRTKIDVLNDDLYYRQWKQKR